MRKSILIGVIAAAIAAIALYTRPKPEAMRPAGPAVPRELFERLWTTRPTLLVGLGDSMTAGFGARNGYSYFARLARNPGDEFQGMFGISLSSVMPDLRTVNHAVSGTTSIDHLEQAAQLGVEKQRMGIVVMTTGGNDLIHNYGRTPPREGAMYGATLEQARPWIANFEQRLNRTLDRIGERFPVGCHIFLANIYDLTDGAGDIEKAGLPAWRDGLTILAAYNAAIARAADKRPNIHLVDIHAAFMGHGIHNRSDHWYYTNIEDPNERGYDALRRLFLLKMAEVLR